MAGMADGMVEWQTEMATYVLFTVHTDDDADDTLIFYLLVGQGHYSVPISSTLKMLITPPY